MRSTADKLKIKNTIGPTFTVPNFISESERLALIDYFNGGEHTYKNTGPVTLNVSASEFEQPLFRNILDRIEPYIGKVKVFSSLFFKVNKPHIIHNDDSYSYPMCYKGINIPLELQGDDLSDNPSLVFYDQYYLEGPAKFFNGSSNIPTYYNECVYDYNSVLNLSSTAFDTDFHTKHLSHLKNEWLNGLSVESVTTWKPGDITVFDTVRLHSSNNFVKQGITSKLGLSIFTEKL